MMFLLGYVSSIQYLLNLWKSIQDLQRHFGCLHYDSLIECTSHISTTHILGGYDSSIHCNCCRIQAKTIILTSFSAWISLLVPGPTMQRLHNNVECIFVYCLGYLNFIALNWTTTSMRMHIFLSLKLIFTITHPWECNVLLTVFHSFWTWTILRLKTQS